MSGKKLNQLADLLIEFKIESTKGLAVIQQATTPNQKTKVFSFGELKQQNLPDFEYVPTLIMIGNVVNLHQQYAWYAEAQNTKSYFDNHLINLQYAS